VLDRERPALRAGIERKLKEQNIEVHTHCQVSEVTPEGVKTKDGREFAGNVTVW